VEDRNDRRFLPRVIDTLSLRDRGGGATSIEVKNPPAVMKAMDTGRITKSADDLPDVVDLMNVI